MNKRTEHHIDKILSASLGKDSLLEPKDDFVNEVLDRIEELESQKSSITSYSPPISKKAWFVIGVSIILVLLALILSPNQNFLEWNKIQALSQSVSTVFDAISYSKILVYSIVSLAIFFILDIFLITKINIR